MLNRTIIKALEKQDNAKLRELFDKPALVKLCKDNASLLTGSVWSQMANAETYSAIITILTRMVLDDAWFDSLFPNFSDVNTFLTQVHSSLESYRPIDRKTLYQQLLSSCEKNILTPIRLTRMMKSFGDLQEFCRVFESDEVIKYIIENNIIFNFVTTTAELTSLCSVSRKSSPSVSINTLFGKQAAKEDAMVKEEKFSLKEFSSVAFVRVWMRGKQAEDNHTVSTFGSTYTINQNNVNNSYLEIQKRIKEHKANNEFIFETREFGIDLLDGMEGKTLKSFTSLESFLQEFLLKEGSISKGSDLESSSPRPF